MKKTMISAVFAALLAAGGYFSRQALNTPSGMSELELANAEALSDEENNDCHYVNGWSMWDIESLDSSVSKKSFYDCCGIKVEGYNPTDRCI